MGVEILGRFSRINGVTARMYEASTAYFYPLGPTSNYLATYLCYLVGAQPPPCCSFTRHLVGKMANLCSFAHH